MLEEVLAALNNWFEVAAVRGRLAIGGGVIALPEGFLAEGQWFRISGSVFNDGLHQWPCGSLKDEEFDGTVWALAVPKAVEDLAGRIEAWQQEYGKAAEAPYASESFGGYSYTKATASSSQDGSCGVSWRSQFRGELSRWRKL